MIATAADGNFQKAARRFKPKNCDHALFQDGDRAAVEKAAAIITEKIADRPTISELARLTHTSAAKLQKDFKDAFGVTIHDYVKRLRLQRAAERLSLTDESVYDIALSLGCKKAGRFSEIFREEYGLSPLQFRKREGGGLSQVLESYLDLTYELSQSQNGARLTDIASQMNVTKSTASAAVTALAERSLVTNEKYRPIVLTEAGTAAAQKISGKHAVLRRYFIEILRLDAVTADADACAVEHVISSATIAAMRARLK